MKATVAIRYFAILRDLAGRATESLQVEPGATASKVYLQLAERYAFPLGLSDVRMAVNDDFTTGDHPLADGDTLVFIPPVSGG